MQVAMDEYDLTDAEVLDTLQYVVENEAHEQYPSLYLHNTPAAYSQDPSLCRTTDSTPVFTTVNRRSRASSKSPGKQETQATATKRRLPAHHKRAMNQSSGTQSPMSDASSTTGMSLSNMYQNRQKQELAYLKNKVRELEQELHLLEQKRADDSADSIWQRVAEQQCVERKKSMSENARLKASLEEHLKFAKQLERIIRKRPNLAALGAQSFPNFRRKRTLVSQNLIDELLTSVEQQYLNVNTVLAESGVLKILKDCRTINVKTMEDPDRRNVIQIEVQDVRRFPFPYQAVGREIWKLMMGTSMFEQQPGISRKVEAVDDTVFATTNLEFAVGSRVGLLQATVAFRRYEEEGRILYIYTSEGECERRKNAKDTFKVTEKGWSELAPIPGHPEKSIIRHVSYFIPTLDGDSNASFSTTSSTHTSGSNTPEDTLVLNNTTVNYGGEYEESEEVGILTELIFGVYRKTSAQLHAMIENTLMEEMIAAKRQHTTSSQFLTEEPSFRPSFDSVDTDHSSS